MIIKFDYLKSNSQSHYFSSNFYAAYYFIYITVHIRNIDKFGILLRNFIRIDLAAPENDLSKFREVFYAGTRISRKIFPTDVCYVLINARALTLYYKLVS